MNSSTAGDSAVTGRTVGGRSVNFSGRRGRPPKKPLFAKDAHLAQDGACLMAGPFHPPALLLPAAPTAASASVMAAIGLPAFPPSAAAVAASAAVDLNFSNAGDDSNDSGICEVVGPPLQPAGNKGKTPFICLMEDILRIMQDKLNANATSGNVNSTSAETMKKIFEAVVGKRGYLLELAGGLNASMEIPEGGGTTISDLLSKAIPIRFAAKTTKSKVCKFMVNVWAVLQVVIANVSIGREARHNLQQYLDLLKRIKAVARREISEANKQDKTSKSFKLPSQAMERMYLADRGSKPPLRFSTCARCGHSILDEPPFNKNYAQANKAVVEK
jgi:hypothetical protein